MGKTERNRFGKAAGLLLLFFMLAPALLAQQWSTAPSDVTTSLTFTNTTNGDANNPAFPATCPATGLNGPFSFSNATGATPISALIPYPSCKADLPIPQGVMPTYNDLWFRLDPTTGNGGSQRDYRFTVIPGSSPSAGDYAGIAVYEASSATGQMTLLNCSRDGGYKNNQRGPSVEATCITPGYKLYVRVWTYQPSLPNFSICVLNHAQAAYGGANDRKAAETPCLAPDVAAGSTPTSVHYVFSCREAGFVLPGDRSDGGDLWMKLTVPASGQVTAKLRFGSPVANAVGGVASGTNPVVDHVGATAYLSDNCSDASRFIEVGYTDNLVSGTTTTTNNMVMRCLPAGATLYIRIHSIHGSSMRSMRYGTVGFHWLAGSGGTGTATDNVLPCGALPITVGEDCSGQVSGDNIGGCGYPGVAAPTCGNFNLLKSSVWYKFEAPGSGLVQIDAEGGAAPAMNRPAIALYASNAGSADPEEGCHTLSLVACDDRQGEGLKARIIKGGLIPGMIYYIRVWSTGTEGNFNLCVSSPKPPPGHCWYVMDFWTVGTTNLPAGNYPYVAVTVPYPGGTTTNYPIQGPDASEVYLIPIPGGVPVHFRVHNVGSIGAYFWGIWHPDGGNPLIWQSGGQAVFGPTETPVYEYILPEGCSPPEHSGGDCMGMETLCPTGGLGPLTGPGGQQFYLTQLFSNNVYGPLNANGNQWADYGGGTYHPHNGYWADLTADNRGCLDGEDNGISWFVFRPTMNGTLGFMVQGWCTPPGGSLAKMDADFALWDLGVLDYNTPPDMDHVDGYDICPPQSPPIRCSSARRLAPTGLVDNMSETYEGHGGYGWLKPLEVQAGHAYALALMPVGVVGNIRYDLYWSIYNDETGAPDPSLIDCEPLILPVELLFLDGWPRDGEVDLAWATASEKNSSHFLVERSQDAQHFTVIGRVGSAGDSQHRVDYGFTDHDPYTGINYYRLRQVDRDGRQEVSNTVVVMVRGNRDGLTVWPNPAPDRLHVSGDLKDRAQVGVQVLNALGQVVYTEVLQVVGGNRVELDTHGLPAGSFLLRMMDDQTGADVGTARFVKQ